MIAALISRSPFLGEPGVDDVCDRKSKTHTHKRRRKMTIGDFACKHITLISHYQRADNPPTRWVARLIRVTHATRAIILE